VTTLAPWGRGTGSQVWFAWRASYSSSMARRHCGSASAPRTVVGTGGRVGKEVAERIRGPKDTCRAPGDHWVDVVRIPMDDDEMIDRGLGARANRRTAALVRLDGVGEVRRRGRTWQCGRHRSRTGPSGRCRGRMRRRRGHRGHMWLCGGGWHRGGGGGARRRGGRRGLTRRCGGGGRRWGRTR
jgi:hypothetical protein